MMKITILDRLCPGKYSVHIEKFENDKLEKLTDSFSFDIIQIGSKSSQEDREKLYGFQLNFDELVRSS